MEEYEFIVTGIGTGANTENIYQASYNIIFCLRRCLIVLSLYAFQNKVQLQLCFNALLQLFYQIYIFGFSPLLEKNDRRMEMFNECLIYLCIVAFFMFNDAKYTKLSKKYISYAHVGTLIIGMLANVLRLVWTTGSESIPATLISFK